jgi:hypothetical protein
MHALCCEVIDYPRSIAQTEWKCRWGVLGEVRRGEWLSSGKLHHDISK